MLSAAWGIRHPRPRRKNLSPKELFEDGSGRLRKYSKVRAKIAYRLDHEFGVSRAEIALQLRVCSSTIA